MYHRRIMAILQARKDDLVTTVYLEMDRLFFVMSNRKTDEEVAFLSEIERAMQRAALTFGSLPVGPDEV